MKHAFLIIAHNNFNVLQALVSALDDERVDIFLHIDKKVKDFRLPTVRYSNLYLIDSPMDIRWGDLAQVKAEYLLLEKARSITHYDYYHIISGVHFPLVSLDALFSYYEKIAPKSVLAPLPWRESEIKDKICRYHFFHYHSQGNNPVPNKIFDLFWRIGLKLQGHRTLRNKSLFCGKYSQWASISAKDIDLILFFKNKILKLFRFTLCPDELFLPVIFRDANVDFEENETILFQKFIAASPEFLKKQDFMEMIKSGCLFARKFDDSQTELIKHLCDFADNK